jgi:protein-tyrosine phosphatase
MFGFLFPQGSQNFVRIPLNVPGRLFASPMPYGPYDPFNQLIKEYRKNRIDVVVPLVTDEEIKNKAARDLPKVYAKEKLEVIRFPIPDLTSPSVNEVTESIEKIVVELRAGKRVVVHCNAGLGRTGVVLACILCHISGMNGDEAITFTKKYLSLNMTDEQIRFVRKWTEASRIAE